MGPVPHGMLPLPRAQNVSPQTVRKSWQMAILVRREARSDLGSTRSKNSSSEWSVRMDTGCIRFDTGVLRFRRKRIATLKEGDQHVGIQSMAQAGRESTDLQARTQGHAENVATFVLQRCLGGGLLGWNFIQRDRL
ncbi:uncharacterized protein FOMMEDRAFT_138827 [Fomitiporia mediterranea MF3/22]|uniref:uncharacterized protein n=1 Tax=Fomitiporia mediterranea (strain MF3/22) TaxID=694068 RepID=UPI0004407700|nr:uncharacterized protein FOMMEDRAFT_138827 [Fomitiporia mediterranea MF3/22]EJD05314.1 hypothetical protein FOMMEDRAFT_138827 [Fomitiporia mediterranea MF3/22]